MDRRNKAILMIAVIVFLFVPGCGTVANREQENLPESCDVAIIGKSLAAMTAALEASRQGARVFLLSEVDCLEQGLLEEGAVAVLDQIDRGDSEESAEESGRNLLEALAASAKGLGQIWFFNLLAANSNRDLDWFSRETGLELIPDPPLRYVLANPSAKNAQQNLLNGAAGTGVQFMNQVTVTEIVQSDSPAFFIVRAEFDGGLQKEIACRSLILADGGYLNSREALEAYAPNVEPAPWRLLGTGKGIRLANDLHLDLVQTDRFSYSLGIRRNDRWEKAIIPPQALLVVGSQILPAGGQTREEIISILQEEKQAEGCLVIAEFQIRAEQNQLRQWPVFSSIESLIDHYGIECPDLGHWYSRPGDRFRGVRIKALAEYCLGGVAITDSGQVLRKGKPVPGLYAAGEITGGLHGQSLLPGASLTETLVMGRKAGMEAAAWARR